MSRKLVLVLVFLALLPALMVVVKARAADPPKNAGGTPTRKLSAHAGNPLADAGRLKPDELKPGKPKVDLGKPKPHSGPKLHGGEKAILKALKQKTSLDFVEVPLQDVLDYLSEKHRIPIQMDSSALKEAGVDDSTPVTKKLSGISLRSALEIILDEIQLKWTIHHDVLMITSSAKAESVEYMYTKCYDVTDLIVGPPSHYDVQGALDYAVNRPMTSGGATGNGAPVCAYIDRVLYDFGPIRDAIINVVATKTWLENGGSGTISQDDRSLVISQTREVHTQIEQLLADLRARRHAVPTLCVELHWLWLDAKQRDHLLASRGESSKGQLSLAVDPQRLRQIAREVPGFHGQVACLNGLATAIAAGDRRPIIVNTIPVIDGAVGYSPTICVPNVGVSAQIWPTLVPGTKTAMLDIVSIITRWGPSGKPAIIGAAWPADEQVIARNPPPASISFQDAGKDATPRGILIGPGVTDSIPAHNSTKSAAATTSTPVAPPVRTHSTPSGSASCPIDRPVMPAQQIGTMLRVPLGKPVIIGSITFAASGDAGLGAAKENPVEVYLIATTSIVRETK